jgi:hypothetical protein
VSGFMVKPLTKTARRANNEELDRGFIWELHLLQLHGGFIAKSTYYKLDRSVSSPPQAQESMFQLTQCNGTHNN